MFSPDFVYHHPPAGIPGNLEGFQQYVRTIRSAFPDIQFSDIELLADGDTVVVNLEAKGTHQDRFWGLEPTGEHISIPAIWIIHFDQGKIHQWWGAWDWWELMEQNGVTERPLQGVAQQDWKNQ